MSLEEEVEMLLPWSHPQGKYHLMEKEFEIFNECCTLGDWSSSYYEAIGV